MKRPNRAGTVEQLPSGTWRVRVTVDGERKVLGVYADEITARRMLKAFLAERDDGAIEAPSGVTLRRYGGEWLDRRELSGSGGRVAVKSIRGERSVWGRHIEPSALADLPIASIRPRDVDRFVLWLRQREAVHAVSTKAGPVLRPTGKPLARAMQREALRLVRQCLQDAVQREHLAANPAQAIRVPKGGRVADLSDDWLRADEIDRLLGCEEISLRNRTAYACAIGLALRLNDLKALRIADVHLDAAVPGPHVRVWIAKSERWHRVPIAAWLAPWLRAHLAVLPPGAQFLFVGADGEPYARDYEFAWAAKAERRGASKRKHVTPSALARAGVDRRIRFHDLRGTCATHLALGTWGRNGACTRSSRCSLTPISGSRSATSGVRSTRSRTRCATPPAGRLRCPRLPTALSAPRPQPL